MFEKHKAAKAKAEKDEALRQFVPTLIDPDGVISQDGNAKFLAYLAEHGYADEQGIVRSDQLPQDVVSEFSLGLANGGQFAKCEVNLLLKQGEVGYCERAARLLK